MNFLQVTFPALCPAYIENPEDIKACVYHDQQHINEYIVKEKETHTNADDPFGLSHLDIVDIKRELREGGQLEAALESENEINENIMEQEEDLSPTPPVAIAPPPPAFEILGETFPLNPRPDATTPLL